MKAFSTLVALAVLTGCSSAPTAPPKPDANGEVSVRCASSPSIITLGDCETKARQACGGPVTEVSRGFGPRLGGDVDIFARYRCTGP
ncbi:hypothetical protein [Luteibacter aegosomatissinici]|uniref:hypothetical protein n=1 Tax=Luteibacter aegosomatissinici TaxID=2911539 RepID=UPI001FF7062C|nr:hypothetical protein [Luteibacter aegosomatissinici]UPG92522.1 hypothetical protein L2Y97_11635 [Luteibacter aegosomatissinici]